MILVNEKSIMKKIEEILNNELEHQNIQMKMNDNLVEAGIDSIEFMAILVYLEEEYGIEIDYLKYFSDNFECILFEDIIRAVINELAQK